jgi:hypothetical protein
VSLHLTLPEDLYGKLAVHLYSAAEGKVPKGAFQRFFCDRIVEYFNRSESHDHVT